MASDEAPIPPASASPHSRKHPRGPDSCAHRRTRVKLSPPPNDSSASEPSISDESALVPTSVPDDSTDASEVDAESSDSSELSESSEDPSSDSSSDEGLSDDESDSELDHADEDTVINLRANRGKKPVMKLDKDALGPDVRTFLKDFLPQIKGCK